MFGRFSGLEPLRFMLKLTTSDRVFSIGPVHRDQLMKITDTTYEKYKFDEERRKNREVVESYAEELANSMKEYIVKHFSDREICSLDDDAYRLWKIWDTMHD